MTTPLSKDIGPEDPFRPQERKCTGVPVLYLLAWVIRGRHAAGWPLPLLLLRWSVDPQGWWEGERSGGERAFAEGTGQEPVMARAACVAAIRRLMESWFRVAWSGIWGGVSRYVTFQGVRRPPGDALFAEGAHPLVGEAVPQGNACCSLGEASAGEVGQVQGVGGQQVVDDHPGAEPQAGGIHGEQSLSQGGTDVVVAWQVRDPGPQACAE